MVLRVLGAQYAGMLQSVIEKIIRAHNFPTEMMPKEFFVTSGKAVSPVSELNAFDKALKNAGIAQCNIVQVSSILPPNCKETQRRKLPVGQITFCVMAKMVGSEGSLIGASIAYAWEKNNQCGIVAEAHGYMDNKALKEMLEWKIKEMARIREIEIGEIKYRIETLTVPMDNYGCVISVLVYNF